MLKKFLPIISLMFVSIIGFTLVIPVLPDIVLLYVPAHLSGFLYGALLSSYAFFQFIGAPILGSFSDKYGRKPLLLVSQLGTTIGWIIFCAAYFVPNIPLFGIGLPFYVIALSRVIDGITGGNISVANAWISDMTERQEKAKAFSMIGATFGIAFLFGPALGGLAAGTSIGYAGTALVAAILSTIAMALIYFQLPESLPHDKRDHELDLHLSNELNFVKKFKRFRSNQFVFDLLFQRLFQALSFAAYTTVIFLYLQQQFGLNAKTMGVTMTGIAIFSILNQAAIVPRIIKRIGELPALYLSFGLLFVGLLSLPQMPTPETSPNMLLVYGAFFAIAYIFNLGISLGQPLFKSLMANHVSEKQQGAITGLDESLLAVGNAISPVVAGSLYGVIGTHVFYFYAGLLVIPHLFVWFTTKHPFLHEPPHHHE